MRTYSIKNIVLNLLLTLLLVTSCDRRPLEVYYNDKVVIRVDVDWMRDFGIMPTGMTFMLYKDGDNIFYTTITNEVHTQYLELEPGVYKLIIFNQSYDEFGSMHFEDLNSHDKAAARANPVTTRTNRKWDQGVRYMADPEDIGVAVDTFEITQDMFNSQLHFVDWHQHDNLHPETTTIIFNEIVEPMITMLHVKVNVKGAKSISGVEANISGMADGFYLSKVDRTTDTGILLLDKWKFLPADDTRTYGTIYTSIPTFGLPYGKERVENRDSTDNVLQLNFDLLDGTEFHRDFNVGKIMKYLTHSGDALTKAELLKHIEVEIFIEDPVDIPPVEPKYASGFNAWVDEWEYGGTFEFDGF